jgi:hypothetical protein
MVEFINENAPKLIEFGIQLVGAFAILATLTRNDADNKIAAWMLKAINFLGANFGNARNAD